MEFNRLLFLFAVFLFLFLFEGLDASQGDADPIYKACVEKCQNNSCKFFSDKRSVDTPWYSQEPLYLRWKEWDCHSDCRYHCMLSREEEREKLGEKPIKYHGKWAFRRVFGIQEPVSVALSTLNLALQFHGWLSFFILAYYKLPTRPNGKAHYEFSGFWLVYGILSMNSWFWSAVFHSRYINLTERLYYSSTVMFLGFALILSILRAFNIRAEAVRIMVAAPLLAFVTTHILFLNLVELNYYWNMVVTMVMATLGLLFWLSWAALSRHPSRRKLFVVLVGRAVAMLLEITDFPPYNGVADARALWQAMAVPLTYVWWSFVRDDAVFVTSSRIKKAK